MKSPLHILHLEDDPNDAALVQSVLETGGIICKTKVVQTREEFVAALEYNNVDLILSDVSLPGFDGMSAAEIVRNNWPSIPLIFVSGTFGEEQAIDSLKRGATDYVFKERLSRLVPAVQRAMLEVAGRDERRKLEADFIESQKMEVLGKLASGAAHDFNNILSVIMGYSELLAFYLGADSPLRIYAEHIQQASKRAAGLTRQLLVFSRKQQVQPVVLDLNDLVKDMEPMLRRLIDANIQMTFFPGKRTGRIKADSGQVGQVLMNLAVNARDAMSEGGKLTIATYNGTLDESDARVLPGAAPGEYVILSVSDSGTGMSDDVKEHMFEAFFTTKPLGEGTGLGLATCQTIVQQSGGHICVQSEVGYGTTFKVYFPRVELPLDSSVQPAQIGQMSRGTETLLVVEDDPSVRLLMCGLLESQGYFVVSASNGRDALQAARDHRGSPIRLLITDVVMPLMGGKAMAATLKETLPDLKIIFTSGYAEDSVSHNGTIDPDVSFLPKPYTPFTLTSKVREILDRAVEDRLEVSQKHGDFMKTSG